MLTPFDNIAPHYADLWSAQPKGIAQRAHVWREIDGLFHAGHRVLDLGCGTGDDALHLAARDVNVTAIDSSPRMIEVARGRGLDAQVLNIEALSAFSGSYDGALSNFGALNCVADIRPLATELARLIRPGGTLAICVLGRFSWRESAAALAKLNVSKAARRWSGRAHWRGMEIYYRSAAEWVHVLAPAFHRTRRISIGQGDHQLYIFERSRT
ncbi:MAG: class I SAM-dependent methyltransferase [Acidobacteriota bacterium]